ncbi:MAG: uncharacterized protein QOE93_1844 [Actinomycetota bacterium]|jgi:uncharacterized membrane protein (UPF0127 family)|nr:uncharacterized protein [Actinomycetota bacterium]
MATTGWLLRDGEVLAAIEVASSFRERSRGLLGRPGIAGALLLRPARSVHSMGMQFTIDVAFCNREMVVVRTVCLQPGRVTLPCLRSGCVIEAEYGSFDRWRLKRGDQLEVREVEE